MTTPARIGWSSAVLFAALGAGAGLAAQVPSDRAVIDGIMAEARDRPQVGYLFSTLTDAIGARLTGSPGFQEAAQWARDQFESWGLADPRLEPFRFGPGWSLESLTAEMTSPWYLPLMAIASAWSPSTPGEVRGIGLYLGHMSPEEIQAIPDRVRGSIVLIDPPQTQFFRRDRVQPTLVDGPARTGAPFLPGTPDGARRAGFSVFDLPRLQPAVVLSPNAGQDGTIFVGSVRQLEIPLANGDTVRSTPIPHITLAAEHYNLIVRLLEAGQPVELNVEVRTRSHEEDLDSYNVLADLPGTDPELRDEVVLIGGHLDSWQGAPGATDNADAVVAAMEAMRLLKAVGAAPRRTIRVALWGGEEQGGIGSQAYVTQQLADQSARDRISVYLNDDPGTGPTYGFYMEENRSAMEVFDRWLGELGDVGVRRNVFEGIGGTDHLPFDNVGIPAFTAIKEYSEYDTRTHHTNTDLAEHVRHGDLTQSAIVLASMAWLASMSDETVPRRPPAEQGRGRWGVSVGNSASVEPIAGVRVAIEGTAHEGLTNERGELVFDGVTSGRYTLVLEHPDYVTLRRANAPVSGGRLRYSSFWLDPR